MFISSEDINVFFLLPMPSVILLATVNRFIVSVGRGVFDLDPFIVGHRHLDGLFKGDRRRLGVEVVDSNKEGLQVEVVTGLGVEVPPLLQIGELNHIAVVYVVDHFSHQTIFRFVEEGQRRMLRIVGHKHKFESDHTGFPFKHNQD